MENEYPLYESFSDRQEVMMCKQSRHRQQQDMAKCGSCGLTAYNKLASCD